MKKGKAIKKKVQEEKKKAPKDNKTRISELKEVKNSEIIEKEFPKTENKEKKKSPKLLISGIILLSVVIIGFLVVNFVVPSLRVSGFSSEINIGFKEKYDDNYGDICYGNIFSCETPEVETFGDEINTEKLGEYQRFYRIKYGNGKETELSQKVFIVDKNAPEISVESEKVSVCPNGKIPKFEMKIEDDYDGEITDKAEIKYENEKVLVRISDSSGNSSEKELEGVIEDKEAPIIDLNGADRYEMTLDAIYEIPVPTVSDNCDDVELMTEGSVDTKKVGDYELVYSAVDTSGNETKIKRRVSIKPVPDSGVVYLTFDDGPGAFTAQLLDVLKKYNVKATFFVTGFGSDEMIKRAYDEGHSIGLHTFTHDYSYVYKNLNNYFDDLNKVQERVKRITGKETYLMRFPGGSSNTVSKNFDGGIHIMSKLVNEVTKKGYVCILQF